MILLIDNYDSFAHNLARYIQQLGQTVNVFRNDELTIDQIRELAPTAIVISPGPCTPSESGICLQVIEQLYTEIPILGVCLGHQAIGQAFGANVVRVTPVHGQASAVDHFGHPLFDGIPESFFAGRYHSLVVERDSIPDELQVISELDGIPMAIAHQSHTTWGVQFHPESILTPCGYRLLANFLRAANCVVTEDRVVELTTQLERQRQPSRVMDSPKRRSTNPLTPHPWIQ